MNTIRCVIDNIIYHNTASGFSVALCISPGEKELIKIVGTIPDICVGAHYDFDGNWENSSKNGIEFHVEKSRAVLPDTIKAIEKFLGSGLIKGIGETNARNIVSAFGTDTLNIIDNDPERLLEVRGIGPKMLLKIISDWNDHKEIRELIMFLESYDISASYAPRIYEMYGNDSIDRIQENPYCLAEDIWGIGFKTADKIAMALGFGLTCFVRLRAGIVYTLNRATDDGHCYLTKKQLYKKASEILECEDCYIVMTLDEMIRTEDVIAEEDDIYAPSMYYSELGVARRLMRRDIIYSDIHEDVSTLGNWLKRKTGMDYDPVQIDAIITATENNTCVLTGGPGTGKTTTVLGIIECFEADGKEVLLAAPTGRAAKRMAESTGRPARTIHRLLGARSFNEFTYNEDNPIHGDVLIVDECSMIDIVLMNNLLKAVPDNMRIVLVGDIDQLPSVGPGNVLKDIIASEQFPVIRLTKIFRQSAKSRIITNAHKVNKGDMPDLSNGDDTDFYFVNRSRPEDIANTILQLVKSSLPEYLHMPMSAIQVLSPMRKGDIGTINLNTKIQSSIPHSGKPIVTGNFSFYVGDKVIQLKNNYDKKIYNGDIGFVKSINHEDFELTVDFEGNEVVYEKKNLEELALAYALTIHKSQGSEYPVVVIPVSMSHYIMLQRNLLYTGITRAKKMVVLVGTKDAINKCAKSYIARKRNTKLSERIQACA